MRSLVVLVSCVEWTLVSNDVFKLPNDFGISLIIREVFHEVVVSHKFLIIILPDGNAEFPVHPA